MQGIKPKRVRTLSFTTTKEIDDVLTGIVKDIKAQGFMVSKTDIINDALLTYFKVAKAQHEKVDNKKVN